jgi:rod shape-determining protein MreC
MRKKRNFFILLFILLCFFVLLNIFTPISNAIRGHSLSLISPFQITFLEKGNNFLKRFEVFRDIKKISGEIEILRKDNVKLHSRISSLLTLEEENKALRNILEVNSIKKENIVFSQVIGKDLSGDKIIIRYDKEIRNGLAVVTPEGTLIGTIEKIYANNFASVELITSPNSSIEVKIQNEDLPIGVLKGKKQKGLEIDLLPKDKLLDVGDHIVALPNEKGISKEIYIGRISEIDETDIEAFKKAVVWQGIDYRYFSYLFVIY